MGLECAYGFGDLYAAAHGKSMPARVARELMNGSQEERNRTVAIWAEKAGWETESRNGSDGKIYLAFCPDFGGKS